MSKTLKLKIVACLAGAGLAAAPAPAQFGCNVNGTWRLVQANGVSVTLRVNQRGSALSGTGDAGGAPGIIGQGRINGRVLRFLIQWANGTAGEYYGAIGRDGRMSGNSYDPRSPRVQASWVADRAFRC